MGSRSPGGHTALTSCKTCLRPTVFGLKEDIGQCHWFCQCYLAKNPYNRFFFWTILYLLTKPCQSHGHTIYSTPFFSQAKLLWYVQTVKINLLLNYDCLWINGLRNSKLRKYRDLPAADWFSMNLFGKGLNVTNVHLYVKILHSSFNSLIWFILFM